MVAALDDEQNVTRGVLARDKPWVVAAFGLTANAESVALAERVIRQAPMPPDRASIRVLDVTRLLGQEAAQEIPERAFADEADTRAVRLGADRQPGIVGQPPDLVLAQRAERKESPAQRVPRHLVQEVALVLARIDAFQQPAVGRYARVVPGCDPVSAQARGVLQQHAELDLPVADHVGVWRAPRPADRQEVGEDLLAVLAGEVHVVQGNAEVGTDLARVAQIPGGRAVPVVVLPVRHVQAFDAIALAQQHQRGDGGIDAAGHRTNDLFGRSHRERSAQARPLASGRMLDA